MEWTLQQQGFDLCYDKRLYDRLVHESAESVRGHLAGGRRLPGAPAAVHREPRRAARGGDVRAGTGTRRRRRDHDAPGRPARPRRPDGGAAHADPGLPRARARRTGGRGPARLLRAPAARGRRQRSALRRLAAVRVRGLAGQRLAPPARRVVLGVRRGAAGATSSSSTSPTRPRRRACACRGTTSRAAAWTLTDRLGGAAVRPRRRRAWRATASTSSSTAGRRTSSRSRPPAERRSAAHGGPMSYGWRWWRSAASASACSSTSCCDGLRTAQ